jgi:uncharacterized hydrophobic protein (TIGR00271 family)
MLQLRVFGPPPAMADVAGRLEDLPGSRHVIQIGDGGSGRAVVTADLVDDAVDTALDQVKRLGISTEDVTLVRLDSIGPDMAQSTLSNVIWSDLLSRAGTNSRPFARYLVLMATAGVIAAFGVIYASTTLIVGAMAISPDMLPITAAATALVLRRWPLAARAIATLIIGLGCACVVEAVMTVVLDALDLLPTGFEPGHRGFLAGVSTVNISTPIVALAAGVAGMLAVETRASSVVGVAISVTTIPASAYLGVAAGIGEASKAAGALLVLGINVACLLIGACLTLLCQLALERRQRPAPEPLE